MQTIIIILSIMAGVFAILSAFLFFYCLKINRSINLLLKNGKARDLRNLILSHIEKVKETEQELKKAGEKISKLENISKITFQKIGIVRFNPFQELGGNQSFAIVLLDAKNNGFVISSLFIKEGNRVYVKSIKGGASEHKLSKEEEKALSKAIK